MGSSKINGFPLGPQFLYYLVYGFFSRKGQLSFDGDPLKYHRFMSSFENSVGRLNVDDNSKLNSRYQYCSGQALKVIECCAVMDPTQGDRRALGLLKDRFGNNFMISEAWIDKITGGQPIKSSDPRGLQDFSDELTV
jgi:hypothetical protein